MNYFYFLKKQNHGKERDGGVVWCHKSRFGRSRAKAIVLVAARNYTNDHSHGVLSCQMPKHPCDAVGSHFLSPATNLARLRSFHVGA